MSAIEARDDFAGTGWGVALKKLGIHEHGVELMAEAVATREANGMETFARDIWDVLERRIASPFYDLHIASPPCQTFSMAGNGAGRAALSFVLEVIAERAYLDPAKLREFGETHDPRTALVLTPLATVARDLPRLVVWEQVPTVLPVWQACAEVLRSWGYSVVTGVLNAEQYGVPQTRKRAVLIARWDGEARMPTPTHSRYYPRDPSRLDDGVLPWVSMAEALGWGMTDAPSPTVTGGGTAKGGAEPFGRWAREKIMRSNYGTGGDPAKRGERTSDAPAPTITSKADRNLWLVSNDKQEHSARRHIDTPAPMITGGHDSGNRVWQRPGGEPINLDPDKPATTVAADPRLTSREHHYHGEQAATSTRVTIEEAALLQSFPPGFAFAGSKGKQFLQVGNAVPPLLAEAILRTLVDEPLITVQD